RGRRLRTHEQSQDRGRLSRHRIRRRGRSVMLQLLISGIIFGSAYALLAMSFNVIYRVAHVVNFAQGELMTLSALITYSGLFIFGIPVWITVPMALIAS